MRGTAERLLPGATVDLETYRAFSGGLVDQFAHAGRRRSWPGDRSRSLTIAGLLLGRRLRCCSGLLHATQGAIVTSGHSCRLRRQPRAQVSILSVGNRPNPIVSGKESLTVSREVKPDGRIPSLCRPAGGSSRPWPAQTHSSLCRHVRGR